MKLADFYLPKRLYCSSEPKWKKVEWTELSKAIHFFDASALFIVDRGLLSMLEKGVRQTLISKRFGWSTDIRDSTLTKELLENMTSDELKAINRINACDLHQLAPYSYGYGYYLALLTIRRQFAKVIRQRVWKEYGRDCKAGEMEAIAEHYGGIGARRLAVQGESCQHDPLLFASDELLVYGAISAVLEGADVVFLTKDPLFMEQFGELMCLLGTDYVASEYGRQYADNPTAFPNFTNSEAFVNPITKIFGRCASGKLRKGWAKTILPRNPYLINFHCWLLGECDGDSVQLAGWTFCGERGMHNLLRVKGSTKGRNVESPNGINIRASFPLGIDEDAFVTIWEDRMIPISTIEFPLDCRLDLRVPSVAAADVCRIHSNCGKLEMPWHEASF